MSALPQATNENPPPVFNIGDKVKLSASCPRIDGHLYYIDKKDGEKYLSPAVAMAFGPTNGFIYTIIDRKELQRRKTSTGPTSATMYEHRLSTNMPHYTRQEEVLKEKLKTPISQTNLIKASGTALTAGQTFDIFDHVRITKNLKVEVAGMSGTREYKAGQMLKVVGDPGSGRRRYVQGVTTASNTTYECRVMEMATVTGDTLWKSVEYQVVSALVKA